MTARHFFQVRSCVPSVVRTSFFSRVEAVGTGGHVSLFCSIAGGCFRLLLDMMGGCLACAVPGTVSPRLARRNAGRLTFCGGGIPP